MTLQEISKSYQFNFNPFSGITIEESQRVIVPQVDFTKLLDIIRKGEPGIIEFVGKKGRGKTTHLNLLQQLTPQFPIFHLDNNLTYQKLLKTKDKVVFIDSIGHLNIFQRSKLFQQNKLFIATTHWSKAWEYKLFGNKYHRFYFKGISKEILKQIINNRFKLSLADPQNAIQIDDSEMQHLITKFKDDYRAILNHLYDQFQVNL